MHVLFKRAFWPLVGVGAAYVLFVVCLTNHSIQKHAIYAHKLQLTWRDDLTKPEQFGFAKNQVAPFYIETPDGQKLFAWHVLPLGLYAEHRDKLLETDSGLVEDITRSAAFQLLKSDPDARLVISFHGNAGTVGAAWRPFYLRSLSAAAPKKIHILTIDYRGFGYSTGEPSEEGLITDGLTAVKWAIATAGVSPDRIALVGQSLGTAVTFGVAQRLVHPPSVISTEKIELGAIISIAGFSSMKELVKNYALGGFIPILSPLRPYPTIQNFLTTYIQESWESGNRVASLVKASSEKLKLFIIHAYNDFEIPWRHSDTLFYSAANATSQNGLTALEVIELKEKQDLHAEGYVHLWPESLAGGKTIQQWVVHWGEHNRVVASAPVSLLVARALGL